jgi:phenylalanine-4-hydroxylase
VFEEGQLYSPVTKDEAGNVIVHLADDHPGASDPVYRARRTEIAAAALAWNPGEPTPIIAYTEEEQDVWRIVCRELAPKHERLAVSEFNEGVAALKLPRDHIPGLDEVSQNLEPLTGFRYVPAAGLVPLREFYESLGDSEFHSTQYVRHGAAPLYTPEPDIIHEVVGHGHLLATPTYSRLHRLAGEATKRVRDDDNALFVSKVFWFSLEFGIVVEEGEVRAYGAGILSSYGEIDEFRDMEHRPLDLAEMGTADYDITHYQPVLYKAESVDEIVEVVGGFFETCTDESINEMRAAVAQHAA